MKGKVRFYLKVLTSPMQAAMTREELIKRSINLNVMIKQGAFIPLFIFLIFFRPSADSTPIPIKFCGNLVIINATIDNRPRNFILDTGTSNILLNARYFSGEPSDKLFVGITGDLQEMQVSNIDIQIGELRWRNVYSQIVSMNLIEKKAGIPIHGLIGSTIFRKYAVHFDYKGKEIDIFKIDRKNPSLRLQKNPPPQTIEIKYKGGTPSIPIILNGRS
jgi:hypothetical protein